jgi:hypothetical protein
MLLAIVVFFGLVVTFELHGISRKLEAANERLENTKKLVEHIVEELRWDEDLTFARELKEWIQEIRKDIVEELRWDKDLTFARELNDRIAAAGTTISREIGEGLDSVSEISNDISRKLDSVGQSLAEIERNTSR